MAGKHEITGSCALCKRTGQQLAVRYGPASADGQLACADEASCVRARIARDASLERHPSGQGRSTWRDEAERLIADAQSTRSSVPAYAQVDATCAVAYALLAVAEAITAVPASDLVSVLDAGLSNLLTPGEAYEAGRHDAAG